MMELCGASQWRLEGGGEGGGEAMGVGERMVVAVRAFRFGSGKRTSREGNGPAGGGHE